MKKKIILIILFVVLLLFGIGIFLYITYFGKDINKIKQYFANNLNLELKENNKKEDIKIIKNELLNINFVEENNIKNQNIDSEKIIDKDEKIEKLRKRFSLRGIIARGDNFVESNQPILALNEFVKALKQSPNDEKIIKKLALVYFDLKKYYKTIETFEEVKESLTESEKEIYIFSLLYDLDFTSSEKIKEVNEKLRNLNLDKEEIFYYVNAINCTINFHECKKNYEEYFLNGKEIKFEKLKNIKNAFINYDNFKIENVYYKDALIIGALFQDKMYTISNILSQKLLSEKTDYKPFLLISGKGYYELGDFENAKKNLEKYYNLDPKDLKITYVLGDVNFKLKDYLTSNLYFNSALKNGYSPKIELQRKLAYNYYLSGDIRSMLNIFGYIIAEKDSTIDDFSLGIYHAILEGRILNAISWAQNGIEKFKDTSSNEMFYGYLGWIYRENRDFKKAREYLKKGFQINPRNPLITLNLGYLEESEEKYNLALMYFKKTININGDGEFGELAKDEKEQIEKYLNALEKNDNE